MGMTMSQKILAYHAGLDEVKPGQLINARLDMVLANDITAPVAINEFEKCGADSIFNKEKGEINLDAIKAGWQTGTSEKVTRMAFNLWNHSIMFDSEEDLANDKISCCYAPSEIFCCSYAPYFWEAVQIRYPEYTKVLKNEKMVIDKEHKENENEYVCEIE